MFGVKTPTFSVVCMVMATLSTGLCIPICCYWITLMSFDTNIMGAVFMHIRTLDSLQLTSSLMQVLLLYISGNEIKDAL